MREKNQENMIPGAKVGRWTLLYELPREGKIRKWRCRCDCGTERDVRDRNLRYGASLSCGCARNDAAVSANAHHLEGMKFGELTVLEKAEAPNQRGVHWRCRCSCGTECVISGTMLVNGRKTRCSSNLHQKRYAFSDVTGQRFGSLVALAPAGYNDKRGSVVWRCRCDCGNEVDVSYNNLQYSNQKSCGCQKKEHEQKLQTFLTHVAGTSIDMLKSKKIPTDNTSGYRGVYLIRGKYVAKIVFQKKQYFLGTYDCIEEAAAARAEAEKLLFDGVADHYRKWKHRAEADPEWAQENPVHVSVERKDGEIQVVFLPDISVQN